ncbi:hypothetical protein [Actinomadura madurae]|uniref:hypothetical protein n=1 Tax=Actinomadura madurae TaxID=1993 RepID=UPI0020D25347|nr:hypothetical protein [Actinomadura madurae]MCP9948064.1 hypothetical protein [Actinomadura madurae]MCP9964830.1 hypothetical protein [Actinomadura madurae]MCP9977319.1 hypothetical protein [Actinomadura madurae]MCQ0011173.1 hypothetical protein [Actinomadura madurae]MCQ0013502.1 hypothetical protein [Actinomadura madurae]
MSSTNGLGDRDAFTKALEAADQLNRALGPLRMDREGTKDRLRSALREPEQEVQAILLLQTLSVELTKALIDIVLEHALRDRYTLLIRNLLGRLAWSEAREIVPPAVWRLLDNATDGDDFRRMAELLDHLGLYEALQELCVRASDSIDEDVREVAGDFGRWSEEGRT